MRETLLIGTINDFDWTVVNTNSFCLSYPTSHVAECCLYNRPTNYKLYGVTMPVSFRRAQVRWVDRQISPPRERISEFCYSVFMGYQHDLRVS